MADFTTTARPYARAVYQQATETSSVDAWGDALGLMATVASDPAMSEVLDNPQLGREQKGELLLKVIGDKLNAQQTNLVRLMAENDRLKALPEVNDQFDVFRAEAEGKIDAEVVSAFPLSDEQEQAITTTLKTKLGREITLTTTRWLNEIPARIAGIKPEPLRGKRNAVESI
jgi:F-type H+-transporting ATPase subunit delta